MISQIISSMIYINDQMRQQGFFTVMFFGSRVIDKIMSQSKLQLLWLVTCLSDNLIKVRLLKLYFFLHKLNYKLKNFTLKCLYFFAISILLKPQNTME